MSKDLSTVSCPCGRGFKCLICWPVPDKKVLLEINLADIERRVAATMTAEPYDLHRKRASELFNVPEDQVTPAQRRYAKADTYRNLYSHSRSEP